jgi:nucleotide sugar dehydrogenase
VLPVFRNAGLKPGSDVFIGVAPRRDWFTIGDKSLRTIPRVVGGTDDATTDVVMDVLGIVCSALLRAPDHIHAEMVKGVENAFRHMEVALANELSLAYPDLDIRKVLELVGTKWNVEEFYPSIGIGGYCIPLSSHYMLQGSPHPDRLSLLEATIAAARAQPEHVARSLSHRRDVRSVAILGLSYLGNIKVSSNSPTLAIARRLIDSGIAVAIHDPYYSDDEIRELTGAPSFEFPDRLHEYDAVLLVAGHREYDLPAPVLATELRDCRVVLDNAGLWKDLELDGIDYRQPGDPNWLDVGPSDATIYGEDGLVTRAG